MRWGSNLSGFLFRFLVWIVSGTSIKVIQAQISGFPFITPAQWLSFGHDSGNLPSSLEFRLRPTLLFYHLSLSSTGNSTDNSGGFTQPSETSKASGTPILAISALGGPAVPLADSQQSLWLSWREWPRQQKSLPGMIPKAPGLLYRATDGPPWKKLLVPFHCPARRHVSHWQNGQWAPRETRFLWRLFSTSVITLRLGCCLTRREPGLCLLSRADLEAMASNIPSANLGDINHFSLGQLILRGWSRQTQACVWIPLCHLPPGWLQQLLNLSKHFSLWVRWV